MCAARTERKRIGVAGISIESGTFSPHRSRYADFRQRRGDELLSQRHGYLQGSGHDLLEVFEPVALLHFGAMPGGSVVHGDYLRMKEEIVKAVADEQQANGPLDGFFFDVHGAMTAEGVVDAEYDLLTGIKALLSDKALLACSQDLHGNVTEQLCEAVDVITTYRTAPHVDVFETRERAWRLLARAFAEREDQGRSPIRAFVSIPVLVSGEMSSTEFEPGRSVYEPLAAESVSEPPGRIWDVSLWVGYAWADEPRSRATAVAIGTDAAALRKTVESVAMRYWEHRAAFSFVAEAGSPDEYIDKALVSDAQPVFLSDAGDNPTAGGAGDCTGTLALLLDKLARYNSEDNEVEEMMMTATTTMMMMKKKRRRKTAVFSSIVDAAAVEAMKGCGVGGEVSVQLGGKLDNVHSKPLDITGRVHCVSDEDGVIESGDVFVIVSSTRRPYHLRSDYLRLNIDPIEHSVVVVKIGYLEPELKAMANEHYLLLSEGGVPPDVVTLTYNNLVHPVYPQVGHDFDWRPQAQLFERRN